MLDGLASAALYKRLRRSARRHWLESTYLRTRFPVLVTLSLVVLAGLACRHHAPHAATLGEVLTHISTRGRSGS